MSQTKLRAMARAVVMGCIAFATAACGSHASDANDADAASDATSPASDGSTTSTLPTSDAGLSGTTGPTDSCPASPGCPPGFKCGRYEDPCTGQVFACGSPCTGGDVCAADPSEPGSQTCEPKACTGKCGVIGTDSCGVAISCGGCAAGQDCVANQCVDAGSADDAGIQGGDAGQCATPTCTPDPQTNLCGTVTNACGETKTCTCPTGQSCQGGVCGNTPPECADTEGGSFCGSVPNACGSGNVTCATCTGLTECVDRVCTACTPPTCGSAKCGSVNNGCGPTVSCGSCSGSEVCYEGACCTPSTCAEAQDAGLVSGCAQVNLGCNVEKSCAPCEEGQICTDNQCVACIPKTCADFGDAGCGHSNGCGNTLDCCSGGLSCQGGSLCCPSGQVAYNGSCCQPSCDPTQPAGSQISCGEVIYCSPGSSGGGGPR